MKRNLENFLPRISIYNSSPFLEKNIPSFFFLRVIILDYCREIKFPSTLEYFIELHRIIDKTKENKAAETRY